jgi:hypothetical protein
MEQAIPVALHRAEHWGQQADLKIGGEGQGPVKATSGAQDRCMATSARKLGEKKQKKHPDWPLAAPGLGKPLSEHTGSE